MAVQNDVPTYNSAVKAINQHYKSISNEISQLDSVFCANFYDHWNTKTAAETLDSIIERINDWVEQMNTKFEKAQEPINKLGHHFEQIEQSSRIEEMAISPISKISRTWTYQEDVYNTPETEEMSNFVSDSFEPKWKAISAYLQDMKTQAIKLLTIGINEYFTGDLPGEVDKLIKSADEVFSEYGGDAMDKAAAKDQLASNSKVN